MAEHAEDRVLVDLEVEAVHRVDGELVLGAHRARAAVLLLRPLPDRPSASENQPSAWYVIVMDTWVGSLNGKRQSFARERPRCGGSAHLERLPQALDDDALPLDGDRRVRVLGPAAEGQRVVAPRVQHHRQEHVPERARQMLRSRDRSATQLGGDSLVDGFTGKICAGPERSQEDVEEDDVAINNSKTVWSFEELVALENARATVKKDENYWQNIARRIPVEQNCAPKTAKECRQRVYEGMPSETR